MSYTRKTVATSTRPNFLASEVGLITKTVNVTDSNAALAVVGVPAVYTLAVTTKAIAGDALTLGEETYVCGTTTGWAAGATTTADATALKALLAVDFPQYTIAGTGGSITLTQKVALTEDVPALIVNKNDTAGTLVATITETTEGVTAVSAGVVADADGFKTVKAGTVWPANDATAKGIIFDDVDVTNGTHAGSMIIAGRVFGNRLHTAPDALAITPLEANGLFIDTEAETERVVD